MKHDQTSIDHACSDRIAQLLSSQIELAQWSVNVRRSAMGRQASASRSLWTHEALVAVGKQFRRTLLHKSFSLSGFFAYSTALLSRPAKNAPPTILSPNGCLAMAYSGECSQLRTAAPADNSSLALYLIVDKFELQ